MRRTSNIFQKKRFLNRSCESVFHKSPSSLSHVLLQISKRNNEQIVEAPVPQVADQFFGVPRSHAGCGDSRQTWETVCVCLGACMIVSCLCSKVRSGSSDTRVASVALVNDGSAVVM